MLLGRGVLGRRKIWPSLCVAQDRLCFPATVASQKATSTFSGREVEGQCGHSTGSILQLHDRAHVCSALLEKDANKCWIVIIPKGSVKLFSYKREQ